MARFLCVKYAKVEEDDDHRWLMVGAFWLPGEVYEVDFSLSIMEMLMLFPGHFEPEDDGAKRFANAASFAHVKGQTAGQQLLEAFTDGEE